MLWRSVSHIARSLVRPISGRVSQKIALQTTASSYSVQKRNFAAQQSQLPRYPVPTLQSTLDKFLKTVRPLVSDDEFKHTEKLVADFKNPDSVSHKLQTLLQQRASKVDNWLSDWWLNLAYLEFRMPVAIHVSPGIIMPPQNFKGVEGQIKAAAKVIAGALDYKTMLDSHTLPADKMGGKPMCMQQYYYMLSTCRVPGAKRDSVVNYPGDHPQAPRHIIVIHNNHIFSVPVYGSDGSPISALQIVEQLKQVVNQSDTPAPAVGILTADNRDNWYKAYSTLAKDKQNKRNFEEIQRGIITICLDQSLPADNPHDENTAYLYQANNGGGSKSNSANRWNDKTIQVMVGRDGFIGANYEHSTAEGPPILAILDHISGFLDKDIASDNKITGMQAPTRLDFNVPNEVHDMIATAAEGLDTCIDDLNMLAYKFDGYGKNFAKSQKLSPDAFIQVAFQLAYYKLYGHSVATYESGSLRKFLRGRTDTIRSCSIASHAYCQAMQDPTVPAKTKADKLREAIAAHKDYTNWVVNGEGIDRHFLGLKQIAIENGFDLPKLFMDPVFESSGTWRISTSQVASKSGGLLGFGPVVPDGYGICYNPMDDSLYFAISTWNSCPATDSKKMANALKDSLMEARDVLVQSQNASL